MGRSRPAVLGSRLGQLDLEHLALQLLVLVEVEEEGLTHALTVDSYKGAGKWLKKDTDRFRHIGNGNLLDCLGLLLVQLHVVESDQVVGRQHEVEVVRDHEAHGLDRGGFGELEADLFSLLLLQEKQCHLDWAYLHCKAGARRVDSSGQKV